MHQMRCQVQPPSRPQPTTSHPCPRSTPWPRTQTAAASTHWRDRWTRVSERSPTSHLQCPNQSVTTFLSSLYSFPFPVWIFFLPYPQLTSMNRSIFLFSFPVWSGGSCWSSSSSNFVWDCCLEVKAICAISWVNGFSLLFGGYFKCKVVCIHIDFQVTRRGWRFNGFFFSVCLYFNSFIFLANIKLRPEVIVIKLKQTRTEHRACCSHACYANKNKSFL